MSQRISHSLIDPFLGPRLKALYPTLSIPRSFPPEGIILVGHLFALLGGVGFAWATTVWWGGLLAAVGVFGNHLADCLDGTHARATGQCRNGGELLDHFTDPISFCYWMIGIAVACGRLDFGIALILILMAMAVLTNIKAKMIGEFTLSTFGPTEFKTLLCAFGIFQTSWGILQGFTLLPIIAYWTAIGLIVIGAVGLLVNLIQAVKEVNEKGAAPDTSEWNNTRS
ncbi:CDP-alcohol phosphatidyltransferase [Polystyrenella longa]|uniref:CDP-alcohol phosphatidyltransferase n=1 Tax=Polystyrenella longa TaxID=2528007 RepID=A0A518CJT8_9PLAN|nr:CDP-alcohol phosphatidyltransferase family protein [Polystyrenella longa]QDU79498.1 CDP-alcohol phosphatidyltransferase [Polystyrenella longa]